MHQRIIHCFIILSWVLGRASFGQDGCSGLAHRETHRFAMVTQRASNFVCADLQANWASYRGYRLVSAVYELSNPERRLKPGELRKVESAVDRSLHRILKDQTAAEGPVLEVRPVITGFRKTNTLLNVVGFAAIQAPISFGGAAVRYELRDGESGDQIGVIACKRRARPWNVYSWNVLYNFEAVGQGSVILRGCSGRLRRDLESLGRLSARSMPGPSLSAE